MSQEYFLGDESVPLDLLRTDNGISQTGITSAMTVRVRNRDTDLYLDFADNLFKGAGHTSGTQVLSELTGLGIYRASFNSTIDQTIGNGTTLVAEYLDEDGRRVTEDLTFKKPPAGVNDLIVPGGGNITIRGAFTAEDRKKLFEDLDRIQRDLEDVKFLNDEIIAMIQTVGESVESIPTDGVNQEDMERFHEKWRGLEARILKYCAKLLPQKSLEEMIKEREDGSGTQGTFI